MLEYVGSALDVVAVLGRLFIAAWGFVVGIELVYVDVPARPSLLVPALILTDPVLLGSAPVTWVLGVTVLDPGELVVVIPVLTVTWAG